MSITVLRLGHRGERDKRTTTHCALVARAFGARKIILSGEKDETAIESIRAVVEKWGGNFEVEYREDWRRLLKNYRGCKIQLTMYGQKLPQKVKRQKNVLVVIGAGKVPPEVYKAVDYNVAIGSQPHSEVAALAVFLLETLGEKQLWRKQKSAKTKIIPQKNSKRVVTKI